MASEMTSSINNLTHREFEFIYFISSSLFLLRAPVCLVYFKNMGDCVVNNIYYCIQPFAFLLVLRVGILLRLRNCRFIAYK